MTVKELKKGEFFTLVNDAEPLPHQVWIRGDYDRSSKTYSCIRFTDCNSERFLKGNRPCYIEFTF